MLSTTGASILVVDDDAGVTEIECRHLVRAGYRVDVAYAADAAIERARHGRFDLLVLDYQLPGQVTGLDLQAQLHKHEIDLPVILVTGFSSEQTAIEALRAGVRDFVSKASLEYLEFLPKTVGRVLNEIRTRQALLDAQDQLRQAQKLEALGRLAGSVAHDFNNLLTIILGNGQQALECLSVENPLYEYVEAMLDAARRSAELTRQLLAVGRQQASNPRTVDPCQLLAGMETLLRHLLGKDIEIVWELGAEGGAIRIDPTQFEQVVMNLAVNARDAMPSSGQLTISTSAVQLGSAQEQAQQPIAPGNYVLLAISDTGCGMDEATQQRIFEPFFTTKPAGVGTGLGLATVYGIVKQYGGHILVSSAPGAGTTFRVYFPAADAEATTAPAGDDPCDIKSLAMGAVQPDDASGRSATPRAASSST